MTAIKHAADALPDMPEKLTCADCQADTPDVALTARGTGLTALCRVCARPPAEVAEAQRRVWLPELAARWVDGDCQHHAARAVVDQLRPDASPMLRLALLDALGWAVRTGRDVDAAYTALVGREPAAAHETPDETTNEKEAA